VTSNYAFQPTPSRCALGFPRPLRGLGAAERGVEQELFGAPSATAFLRIKWPQRVEADDRQSAM
jgi:hypothetical protein